MRAQKWVTGGAVVALLAVAAGCSGGSAGQSHGGDSQTKGGAQARSESSAKVVQAAYKSTEAAHTAKVNMKMTMHVQGRSMTMAGHGVTDFAKKRSRLQMGPSKGPAKVEVRTVNGQVYQKLPAQMRKQSGSSKPWISFDMNAMTKKTVGASMGQLTQNTPKDPSAQLGYLRGVSDKGMHKVGTETVHGAKTTRYKADIDWDKALPNAKKAAQRLKKATGSSTMPVNVWLDKKGRVAQMKFTQKVDQQAAGGGGKAGKAGPMTMDITQSMSDYGTPVHVTAPPKDQTIDAASLAGGARKGGGH